MGETITGKVTYMGDEKKFGNYGFKVSGYDEWFRTKSRCEGVLEKGNSVSLQVKQNDRGDYVLVAAPKLAGGGGGGSGYSGKGGGGGGGDTRNASIQWQHSQEMAILAAEIVLAQGAFKLGAATKPDERRKQILALVDDLTCKFYKDASDQAPLKKRAETEQDLGETEEPESAEPDAADGPAWDEE